MIPSLRERYCADFVIANAENAAGGTGITPDIARVLISEAKSDVLTLGNHAWAKKEIYPYLNEEPRILRPANYPPGVPGRGYGIYESPAGPIAVISLMGRVFMAPLDDPFRAADAIISEVKTKTATVIVDMHAEATSEKQVFGWYVNGRVSAVIGTHTHVQTADEQILTGGTAYLTDVGMTGPIHSIIGMRYDIIVSRFTSQLPAHFEVAEGDAMLCAALIETDDHTGRALNIQRLQIREPGGDDQPAAEMQLGGE
ncbi:MAG: TIGR00282 family metallophosphoesterase [Armatimonadetes bacterium]|nr:TIGR00282 family metallophosphoesterase [Armatimonadota bacterium]